MTCAHISPPFALSLSKGLTSFGEEQGFDKLSPNGSGMG